MKFIGVDLGTSSVKLLMMEGDGGILGTTSREYNVYFPKSGWSEQDPRDWYEQALDGIKELTDRYGKADGIGIAGQMHGLVTLDENDQVIRRAILWNDGRSQPQTDYLNNVIGKEKLTELTGNIAYAGFTAPKILWMKENEPENFARIRKIMLPKDYLNYMLTGEFATDPSDASGTLYYDVKDRCWSEAMCSIIGIKTDMLPRVYESYEKIGTVKPELIDKLGLNDGCILAAGAGDNAGAAVGMGIVGDGKCNISLGTSGTIFISSDRFADDKYNHLHSFAHADGAYHAMGCILSAASCNNWWIRGIIGSETFTIEGDDISPEDLGNDRVFFLPYLMGERSPINDTAARASFIGMSMDTSRKDMTQAMFEGVAFALRDCLEAARAMGIDVAKSGICGGGAKNDIWCRIVANVLGITLEQTENQEGPSFGGAILAAVAAGQFESVADACDKLIKIVKTTLPDEKTTALYEERYQEFSKIYPALKETFAFINDRR